MFMQGHAIWSTYHPALEPVQLPLPAEEISVLLEKIIVSALDTTNKADHAPSLSSSTFFGQTFQHFVGTVSMLGATCHIAGKGMAV